MKLLREALVDYNIAQLQGLAYKRGLSPPKSRSRETLKTFTEELLSPASVAIAVDDLSEDEMAALKELMAAGGFLEARKFTRRYGPIRAMGSGRLLREKPWETPANPAEGLWYRGFIFKGFQHTSGGPEEVIFIPTDLQPFLPLSSPKKSKFEVSLATTPAHIYSSSRPAREDLFTLLAYLQSNFVRLTTDDQLPAVHQKAIKDQFSFLEHLKEIDGEVTDNSQDQNKLDHWFEFVLHLARRLDFLRKQGQRLKLHSQTAKVWLQKTPREQIRQLQDTWRIDPTWNDLWHVPGLQPKQTGWENSPMLGRSKILAYLSQTPVDEWIGLASFVQTLKRTEPDFQRPNGDYQSWYIYDAEGNALMGFEHWDQVEGGLIKHLIVTILFAFGIVDLGASAAGLPPTVFRINALGQAFLFPETASPPPSSSDPGLLRINPTDFTVRVPAGVSLYDRFQLARFATLVRRESERVIYQIDRQSYHKALEQSIELEQVLAFLNRATRSQTPLSLVEAMRNWDRRSGAVKLERLTVLRVNQDILPELLNHPQIGPLLGVSLGPRAVLVPGENVTAVRKLLLELGYLEE
jgi:hypothetical protein